MNYTILGVQGVVHEPGVSRLDYPTLGNAFILYFRKWKSKLIQLIDMDLEISLSSRQFITLKNRKVNMNK